MNDPKLIDWLLNGERGLSSEAIVSYLLGFPCKGRSPSHPYDPDDLRRCRLLLEKVPSVAALFPNMASCSETWGLLVEHWQELCDTMDQECPEWRQGRGSAPKTYTLMAGLRP